MSAGGKKGSKARQNGGKGKRMNVPFTTDGQLGQRLAESSLGSHQGNMINDFIAHLRTPCSMCPAYCDKVCACGPVVGAVRCGVVHSVSSLVVYLEHT